MDVTHPASCIVANIRATSRIITQFYDAMLKPSGLRITQFTLIVALIETEPISLTKFADFVAMDRTTLARNLSPLEREGWLVVAVDEFNKRQRIISTTDDGRKRYQEALKLWWKAQAHMLERFGTESWEAMLTKLNTLSEIAQQGRL
ncbi:MAG: MarR family winged helix-turn-helix transcriptional regulator [Anaerolineae bacterium]